MQSQSISLSDKVSKLLSQYESDCQNDDKMESMPHDCLMKFYEILEEYIEEEVLIKLEELRYECTSEQDFYELDEDIEELHVHLAIGEDSGVSSSLSKRLKDINIVIENITFPYDDNLKHQGSEISDILWRISKVDFIKCDFYSNYFRINNNTYFKNCNFKNDIFIEPFSINNFDELYRYSNCTFNKEVYVIPSKENKEVLCNLFEECNFLSEMTVQDLSFKKSLFKFPDPLSISEDQNLTNDIDIEKIVSCYNFNSLIIKNCIFENDVKLNGFSEDCLQEVRDLGYELQKKYLTIENLEIIDTKFEAKLEIKNASVKNINFNNSNVEKIFDIFQSRFIKATFRKSIFSDFAGFEEVEFGKKDDFNQEYQTKFIYTTFMSFSNFRKAVFHSGLDFERANLKEQPNFLHVKIEGAKNTNRETYRIIKNSFDKVNNKIEYNKFFLYEIRSHKRDIEESIYENFSKSISDFICERRSIISILLLVLAVFIYIGFFIVVFLLCAIVLFIMYASLGLGLIWLSIALVALFMAPYLFPSSFFTYLVLKINQYISDFGDSYIRPIFIFLISLILYTLVLDVHENIFYEKNENQSIVFLKKFVTQDWFVTLSDFLNSCAANVPLFSKALESKDGIQFISLLFFIWFGILTWQTIVAVKRNTQH